MDAFTLDASLAAAWCFVDEQTSYTEAVMQAVSRVPGVLVPRLWAYEVRNTVLMGLRRKRITALDAEEFLVFLDVLPVRLVDPVSHRAVFALAETHGLTFYDAAYVELALQEGLKLATLDGAMRKAALRVGVAMLELPPH